MIIHISINFKIVPLSETITNSTTKIIQNNKNLTSTLIPENIIKKMKADKVSIT